MRSLLAASSFLTIAGRGTAPDRRAVLWFGPVGALVGLALGGVWVGAEEVWNPFVAAALVVAADAVVTGGLHYDGLADSADGLLPHLERARRLEVMRGPEVGAFALLAIGVVLLIRFAGLASADLALWSLVPVWAVSRALAAASMATQPYARSAGLASAFEAGHRVTVGVAALVIAAGVVLAVVVDAAAGGVAVGAAVVTFVLVIALARARLGGYTGDVLGAGIVTSETVGVLTLAGVQ